MQQVWIPRIGAPSVLEVRESADPEPESGQVRIQVQASGINFADLMARMGLYPDAPPLPAVVGYEVAGVIDAVGAGVDESRLGQDVVAMTRFGGYSSAVTVPARQAVERPEGLDAVHAAAIPVTGLTAWMMLEQMARVREGDRVLVHSAGGGVGLMALDLIKRRNAVAIGTASAHKHPFLLERGYNQVIDYRTDDFAEVLAEQEAIDIILDPVGGASWAKGLRLLAPGGRLVCFGFSSNAVAPTRKVWSAISNLWAVPWTRFNPVWLMNHNAGVLGCNMGHMWEHSALVTRWLSDLIPLWQQGQIRPVIHATFPFSQAAEAHQLIHDRQNLGKVVLIPDGVT